MQVVQLVAEVPVEILVALESLALWDHGVFLVPLETLAQLEKRALWVSLVLKAGLELSAQQEQEESLET